MRKTELLAVLTLAIAAALFAAEPDFLGNLRSYHPQHSVSGTIRVWGNNYIPALMKAWEDGFQTFQPNVKFETKLPGTEAALAGLYAKIADVVFIGREVYVPERNGFRGRFGYDPLEIQISSGSFATPHKTFSLQIFVHKDNPMSKLTLQEADAVFGCELRRGATRPIRNWGQLGLTGAWANEPIHVYGYNFDTGMAGYFRRVVLNDSPRWNDELKDFDNGHEPNGEVINAGVYILQALAKDPYGIAFANVLYGNPSVKTLALATQPGQPYYEPTKENVWLRKYPISRFTTLAINRPPGEPVDPKVREFVRYLLSKQGMAAVVRDGSYLPLTQELIDKQVSKLE